MPAPVTPPHGPPDDPGPPGWVQKEEHVESTPHHRSTVTKFKDAAGNVIGQSVAVEMLSNP